MTNDNLLTVQANKIVTYLSNFYCANAMQNLRGYRMKHLVTNKLILDQPRIGVIRSPTETEP